MEQSHYNKEFKHLAQKLRKESTQGEIILWNNVLKNRNMYGFQFLRQFAIDDYIVDFVCRRIRLVIEVDGYSHNFKFEKDNLRDEYLKKIGYTILRFTEDEVKNDIQNVIRSIENYILNFQDKSIPLPPSPRGKQGL